MVDAGKVRLGRQQALELAKTVKTLVVARGKKIITVDLVKDHPGDEALAGLLLGPTGNLRAPTLRLGKTLLIGFHEEAYKEHLG